MTDAVVDDNDDDDIDFDDDDDVDVDDDGPGIIQDDISDDDELLPNLDDKDEKLVVIDRGFFQQALK